SAPAAATVPVPRTPADVAPPPSETEPPAPEPPTAVEPQPDPQPEPTLLSAPVAAAGGPAGGLSLVDVRRLWPDIVEAVKTRRRLTWIHLTQHAQVVAVDGTTLTLGFSNAG